jgi:hypothetical protein
MKTIFAVWVWHVGCSEKDDHGHWQVKSFGSASRAATWISQNFCQFVKAFGAHIEVECDADIPVCPPEDAILLVGDIDSNNHKQAGRYPAVNKSASTQSRHKNIVRAWSRS